MYWIAAFLAFHILVAPPIASSTGEPTVYPGKETIIDLGDVLPGARVERKVPVLNSTSHRLQFQKISTSCGCTHAKLDSTSLEPGESTVLTLTIALRRTPQNEEVEVVLTAGDEQEQFSTSNITLKAHICEVLAIGDQSGYVDLGKYDEHEGRSEVEVPIRAGEYPLDYDEIRVNVANGGIVRAVLKGNLKENNLRLAIAPTSNGWIGCFSEPVEMNFFKQGSLLPVNMVTMACGEVTGPLTVSKKSLIVGGIHTGDMWRSQVVISPVSGNVSVKIVGVRTSSDSVNIASRTEGANALLDITYRAGEQAGPDEGSIFIDVQTDKVRTVRVEYLARVIHP